MISLVLPVVVSGGAAEYGTCLVMECRIERLLKPNFSLLPCPSCRSYSIV